MTRGRELPVNSKVRRRLFSEEDLTEQYTEWDCNDPLSKVVKTEYIARNLNNELILKGMKWNFDFNTERSMRGNMQWYKKGSSNEWVKMQPSGRTIHMRKRSREPLSGSKFVYEGERPKVRRLSPHTVALRRGFFTDGRIFNVTLRQAADENILNKFTENPPSSQWDSEEEAESSDFSDTEDEIKNEEEKQDEASNNIEDKDGVETNNVGLADTNYQGTGTDMIEVDKDANDNQEPSISEGNFEKLHIEDKDNTDIEEQDEAKPKNMQIMNEATPKNEKNKDIAEENKGMIMFRAKKRLDDSSY